MSVSYWMCQGIGIRTNELLPFLSTQKCVQFMKTQLPDEDIQEDKFDIDDYLYGEPFDNLAEMFTVCDDTDSLTYGDRGGIMKILSKKQMKALMEDYPYGGIVFAEYTPDVLKSELMVTDGDFGAREVIPHHGEVFDFDWNIEEYGSDSMFAVFDNEDVLQMIQTLTSGLQIYLNYL